VSIQIWRERARFSDLRSVIDPSDQRGIKNEYIDLIHKMALERYFPIANSDTVLDYGCGIGRFSGWLANQAQFVVGVDVVFEMLGVACQQLHAPNLALLCFPAGNLPIRDNCVDKILSVWVLQHVLEDSLLRATIAEFERILKPGGKIALIDQVQQDKRHTVAGYVRQRLVEDYDSIFQSLGFNRVLDMPLRVPSFLTYGVTWGLVPRSWLRLLVPIEWNLAKNLHKRSAYADYLLVFQKSSLP
jgi:ubiquinone/menaquinone biosynthesis C-methylase UbiE